MLPDLKKLSYQDRPILKNAPQINPKVRHRLLNNLNILNQYMYFFTNLDKKLDKKHKKYCVELRYKTYLGQKKICSMPKMQKRNSFKFQKYSKLNSISLKTQY